MTRFLSAVPEEIEALEKLTNSAEVADENCKRLSEVLRKYKKRRRNKMSRFLGYLSLGFFVAWISYCFDFSAPCVIISLCLGFIIISIVEWRIT